MSNYIGITYFINSLCGEDFCCGCGTARDNCHPFFCPCGRSMIAALNQGSKEMKITFEVDLARGDGVIRWKGATLRTLRRLLHPVVSVIAAATVIFLTRPGG